MLSLEQVLSLKAGVGVKYVSKPNSATNHSSYCLYMGPTYVDDVLCAKLTSSSGVTMRVKCSNYGKTWAIERVNEPGAMFDQEWKYLLEFASREIGICDNIELVWNQLLALWTAYCFHKDLDVDTALYDKRLIQVWEAANRGGACEHGQLADYDAFESFMATFLV